MSDTVGDSAATQASVGCLQIAYQSGLHCYRRLNADGDNEHCQSKEARLSDHVYLSKLNLCQRRVFSAYCGFDSVGWSGTACPGEVTGGAAAGGVTAPAGTGAGAVNSFSA